LAMLFLYSARINTGISTWPSVCDYLSGIMFGGKDGRAYEGWWWADR
jgi:hypothetical protein